MQHFRGSASPGDAIIELFILSNRRMNLPPRHRSPLALRPSGALSPARRGTITFAQTTPPAGAGAHRRGYATSASRCPDPYRYFENMKDPEVVAWMKAQADFARTTLDRIPGRAALLAADRRARRRRARAGFGGAGQQWPVLLSEAIGERESAASSTCAPGSRARSACSSIPRRSEDATQSAFRHRLLRAFAGQPVRRVRHIAGQAPKRACCT